MKLEELKSIVSFYIQKLEKLCPMIELRDVEYKRTMLDREVYHVQISFELKLSADQKSELFLKEVEPTFGFNFDLDHCSDKQILDCLAQVFSQAENAFMTLERDLPTLVKQVKFQ